MAIWAGSSINSNETANLINQFWNAKAIPMIRRKNGLLYAVLGKGETGSEPMSMRFQRESKVSGLAVQFNLMGRLKAINMVADGSGETATWGGTVIPTNVFGGVTLPLQHYADAEYFPDSELDRFQGDELRTRDWIQQKMEYLILSFEDSYGTALNTGTAALPGRTSVCPWRHQIAAPTLAGETTYTTYGMDRTDSANYDFAGNVQIATGDLTLAKIRTTLNTIKTKGGNATVGLAETTLYGKIQALVEAYTVVNYDETWSKFGGDYVQFAGTKYILEQRMPTQLVGLIDPTSWVFWKRDKNFTRGGIQVDPSRVATHVLVWGAWQSLYCNKPNSNGLLTGCTS